MGKKSKMSGIWSRFVAPASKWLPLRRGIKTTKSKKGGHPFVDKGYGDTIDTIRIEHSRWNDYKALDDAMFHATLTAIPLALVTLYCNMFIGPAKLQPIPEGYEPRDEEYEWIPITRFFVRNFQRSEQQKHEMSLHKKWQDVRDPQAPIDDRGEEANQGRG